MSVWVTVRLILTGGRGKTILGTWVLGMCCMGKKFEHKNVAKIVNVDFTVSLEELEAKLYNGGTD